MKVLVFEGTPAEILDAIKTSGDSSANGIEIANSADFNEFVAKLKEKLAQNTIPFDKPDGDAEDEPEDECEEPDDECDGCICQPVILNHVRICGVVASFKREAGKLVVEVDHEPNPYVIYLKSAVRTFYQSLPLATGEPVTVTAQVTPTAEGGDTCKLYVYNLRDIKKHNTNRENFCHD